MADKNNKNLSHAEQKATVKKVVQFKVVGNKLMPYDKSTVAGAVTVFTHGGSFTAENILVVTDYDTDKKWNVNYTLAKYYEENAGVIPAERPGDFTGWLKDKKLEWSPGYKGTGVPGAIKIIGTVNASGTLVASKIVQHIQ